MKIKIAHLYYDIMNLYGENGNVRALEHHLNDSKIETEIHFLTIDDDIDFSKYDIFYIGSGSNENTLIVLEDILKRKKDILKAIDDNKLFICTGSAIDLFGKNYISLNKEYDCLNIFSYTVKELDFRIVGDQKYSFNNFKYPLIGFENRNKVIINNDKPLFNVIEGTGSDINSKEEGIKYKNFFGTYLLGPILIRNPYFTDYLLNIVTNNKIISKETYEYLAYKEKDESN